MDGGVMRRTKTQAPAGPVAPLPPHFRARNFTDSRGQRRFGISLALNGSRFAGSVLMQGGSRADPGGVAHLLESLAAFVRSA
jgi:hypothetical protein